MKTPRTDKLATTLQDYAGFNEVVPADECREIERELIEYQRLLSAKRAQIQRQAATITKLRTQFPSSN